MPIATSGERIRVSAEQILENLRQGFLTLGVCVCVCVCVVCVCIVTFTLCLSRPTPNLSLALPTLLSPSSFPSRAGPFPWRCREEEEECL